MHEADDAPYSADPPLVDDGLGTTVGAQFWVLSPSRRAAHWAATVLAVVLTGLSVAKALMQGDPSFLVLFVLVLGWFSWRQLRAVTAVWHDAQQNSLTLFRAAGGAVRTHPDRVRRIDRGWFAAHSPSRQAERAPLRIVTDQGSATLSVFFEHPEELADDLAELNPGVRVEL